MITAFVIFAVGLALSAFFSGSETGFYRAPRVRLVIDGVGGDPIARGLLWASNHPEAFVATALVGNNLANNVTAFATVMGARAIAPGGGTTAELVLTLLATPVVFILGELIPKRAFLEAPYRLLRRCGPALGVASVVLAPVSVLLWGVSRVISRLTGGASTPLRMVLRRNELQGVFDEGHAVGLLSPAQRDLAVATLNLAARPIREFMTPIGRHPRLAAGSDRAGVLALARRHRTDALPIERSAEGGLGYRAIRASRCLLIAPGEEPPTEGMPEFRESTPFLRVVTHLESNAQPLAAVVATGGRVVGFVSVERLQEALWENA
ncbi:MAG: CNNM domain-containing protein [Planctomycetota bacterium]